jgi:hypothetical protein
MSRSPTFMSLSKLPLTVVLAACVLAPVARAQQQHAPPAATPKKNPLLKLTEPWPESAVLQARRTEAERRPLFQSTDPLAFKLTADFKLVNKDRDPESTVRYPAILSLTDERGREQTIHVRISPRGHFRRMARNCAFVPLRVELPPAETAGTVFEGQTTLKLGTHCQDEKTYEQITLREYLTYPMFNVVTPRSFRARLARATYVDAKSGKAQTTRYALFIEHENDVARRMGGRIVELPRTEFKDMDAPTLTTMMLFEYMIGNTDFSLWALHNIRLVQDPNRTLFPVPYDFDLSGLVNAPYAIPDRRFGIRSVVDRLYRGPCRTVDEMDAAAAAFRDKRGELIGLVEGMRDLDSGARSEMKSYLESFFRGIERPANVKRQFVDGCKAAPTM